MQQQAMPQEPLKRRVPVWVKLLLVLLALAGSVAYGMYKVGQGISDPERIAQEYVRDLAAGRYDAAYQQIKIDGGAWVDASKFAQAMDNQFAQCSVADMKAKAGRKQKQEDGTVRRQVVVDFTTEEGQPRQWQVDMVQDGKRLGLYDNWKIVPTEILQKDWTLTVPAGAKLSVDRVPVDGQYKKETKANEMAAQARQDVYVLPQVFRGVYRVQAQLPGGELWEEQLETDQEQTIAIEPDGSVRTEVEEVLEDAYDAAYSALFHGGDLDELEKYVDRGAPFYEKIEQCYSGRDKSYARWQKLRVEGVALDQLELLDADHLYVEYTVRQSATPRGGGEETGRTERGSALIENRGGDYLIVSD